MGRYNMLLDFSIMLYNNGYNQLNTQLCHSYCHPHTQCILHKFTNYLITNYDLRPSYR